MFNEQQDTTQDFFSLKSEKKVPEKDAPLVFFSLWAGTRSKKGAQSIICIYLVSANDEKLGDVYIV